MLFLIDCIDCRNEEHTDRKDRTLVGFLKGTEAYQAQDNREPLHNRFSPSQ